MTSRPGTDGGSAAGPVRPRSRPRRLAVLVAVCSALWLSAVPGVAAAAPPMSVTPFVDCYRENPDGTLTVVLGYTSTWKKATTMGWGSRNSLHPSQYHRSQPKQFLTGTQHGVLALRLSASELDAGARWELDRTTLYFSSARSASECSPSTPLPALGNGAGFAVVLVAGGAFGVWFVRRVIRRSAAPA
jgi:hypothetical protein